MVKVRNIEKLSVYDKMTMRYIMRMTKAPLVGRFRSYEPVSITMSESEKSHLKIVDNPRFRTKYLLLWHVKLTLLNYTISYYLLVTEKKTHFFYSLKTLA